MEYPDTLRKFSGSETYLYRNSACQTDPLTERSFKLDLSAQKRSKQVSSPIPVSTWEKGVTDTIRLHSCWWFRPGSPVPRRKQWFYWWGMEKMPQQCWGAKNGKELHSCTFVSNSDPWLRFLFETQTSLIQQNSSGNLKSKGMGG